MLPGPITLVSLSVEFGRSYTLREASRDTSLYELVVSSSSPQINDAVCCDLTSSLFVTRLYSIGVLVDNGVDEGVADVRVITGSSLSILEILPVGKGALSLSTCVSSLSLAIKSIKCEL